MKKEISGGAIAAIVGVVVVLLGGIAYKVFVVDANKNSDARMVTREEEMKYKGNAAQNYGSSYQQQYGNQGRNPGNFMQRQGIQGGGGSR